MIYYYLGNIYNVKYISIFIIRSSIVHTEKGKKEVKKVYFLWLIDITQSTYIMGKINSESDKNKNNRTLKNFTSFLKKIYNISCKNTKNP